VDPRYGVRRGTHPLTGPDPTVGEVTTDDLTVRHAEPGDGRGIGDVLVDSWRATFDFPAAHPDEDVRVWVVEHLVPTTESWVAVHPDGTVVGVLSLSETMVDQLYLSPSWIGRGLGTRLLDLAKTRRPDGLDLYCFQANARARRFYERHGFEPIAFGDGSGNEERQPDIRYAWRPA
jgi:GNAT superfamily N-acetyltransferase